MQQITMVNPFDCRLWALHDRIDHLITEETCRNEIDSFLRHGQLVPTLGRPLHGDPNHKVELIYGARRLFVARHLNTPLKVELRDIPDRDAIIAMDIENRQRTDICAYERGISYSKWIHSGHFKSQEEIARVLKVSASQVSRLLGLARLPAVVIEAFSDPAEIREGWGLDLLVALEDPNRRQSLIEQARAIIRRTPRLNGKSVYHALITSATAGRKIKPKIHDEVVTGRGGTPLFRIQYQTKAIALQLPLARVSSQTLVEVRRLLVEILENAESLSSESLEQKKQV